MIQKYTFSFSDLKIDYAEINRLLGYANQELPEPFASYLTEAIICCNEIEDFQGVYLFKDGLVSDSRFRINGEVFQTGKTIAGELNGSEMLALFICTAGKTYNELINAAMNNDPVVGYVYDVLGSSIVEAIGDKIAGFIRTDAQNKGFNTTNRFSPGYCHWNVNEQQNLFKLFNGDTAGVSLSESSLMFPTKSISGVIGVGKSVEHRDYQCNLCTLKNCSHRTAHLH